MRILHLMPYIPVPPIFGGALRIYHLLKNLARRHEVTVVAYGSPNDHRRMIEYFDTQLRAIHLVPLPWVARYRRLGQFYALGTSHSFFYSQLVGQGDAMQRKIDQLLTENDFDVVQAEFAPMGSFQLKTDAVKILDAHNVEYDNFRRMWVNTRSLIRKLHYYREYKKFAREEIEICRKHDAILVTSARDKAILDADVPDVPKFVVPNGVETSYFKPSTISPEPSALIFTGMMAYVPNYDGMVYFLDHIFPLIQREVPEAKIYIVGNRPPRELRKRASKQVVITGYVEDVRPFVWRASVYVVPLRMGSGTRLKVLEAMAMKKPIVTTSIGCEGIDVRHGESVLIADTPHAFAHAVVELLRRPELQSTLIQNGYDLVRSSYEWSVIDEHVETVYQALVQREMVYDTTPVPCPERSW